ncbi:unnamed protein product, partial [marine sediment metagenome]
MLAVSNILTVSPDAAYTLTILGDGGSGFIIYDFITVEPTGAIPTYSWVNTTGDTYSFAFTDGHRAPISLAKNAQWVLTGVEGLIRILNDTSTPTTPAAGKFGTDSSTIYYTLAEGESINDLHFEVNQGSGGNVADINSKNHIVLNFMELVGGSSPCNIRGSSTGFIGNYVIGHHGNSYQLLCADTSSSTWNFPVIIIIMSISIINNYRRTIKNCNT